MMKYVGVREFKQTFGRLSKSGGASTLVVTKNGKPYGEFRRFSDHFDFEAFVLSQNRRFMRMLHRSAMTGPYQSQKEMEKKYGLA